MNYETQYQRKIRLLEERITFLESEEYGQPIYDMGFKAGVIHQKKMGR